jgi:hypothetical protein
MDYFPAYATDFCGVEDIDNKVSIPVWGKPVSEMVYSSDQEISNISPCVTQDKRRT